MGDRGYYAFMVSKQQTEHGMDISLFLESPFFANVGLHSAPDSFTRKPFPFHQ